MRWGDRLEHEADAGAGDFIYVSPFVPHQEINPAAEASKWVIVRNGHDPIVVNLEPRTMAGATSEGMLLDIGYADGLTPVLARPESSVPDGARAG